MKILHVSDLHFVDGDGIGRIESGKNGPLGNRDLVTNLARLSDRLMSADIVVVSGDTTDSGTQAQWRAFLQAVDSIPNLAKKIFLVPGNHDLNEIELQHIDSPTFDRRRVRRAQFLNVRSALAENSPVQLDTTIPSTDIDDLFPYIRTEVSASGLHVAFIAINTVKVSRNFLGNAVGYFAIGEIHPLVERLQRQGYVVVIAGHHHPLPYFDSSTPSKSFWKHIKSLLQGAAMEAIDGVKFLDRLETTIIKPVLYLHGHKHIYRLHVSRATGLQICGAPSLLFGDESTGNANCIAVQHEVSLKNGHILFKSEPIVAKEIVGSRYQICGRKADG